MDLFMTDILHASTRRRKKVGWKTHKGEKLLKHEINIKTIYQPLGFPYKCQSVNQKRGRKKKLNL